MSIGKLFQIIAAYSRKTLPLIVHASDHIHSNVACVMRNCMFIHGGCFIVSNNSLLIDGSHLDDYKRTVLRRSVDAEERNEFTDVYRRRP